MPVLFSAALTIAALAGATSTSAIAAPVPAPPAKTPVCALFAYQPVREGGTLTATGGRFGCSSTATVTVKIVLEQKDANPRVIGELAQSGTEVSLSPKAPCNTGKTIKVHTETISSTGSIAHSPSVTFYNC